MRVVRLAQFLLAMGIFTYYSLTTQIGAITWPDSRLHFLGNLLLFLSARAALMEVRSHWFILAFVLIYGTGMEFMQMLLPQRLFDVRDLAANWLGVGSGLLIALTIELLCRRITKSAADDSSDAIVE